MAEERGRFSTPSIHPSIHRLLLVSDRVTVAVGETGYYTLRLQTDQANLHLHLHLLQKDTDNGALT